MNDKKNTFLIVGLGNPGKEYQATRHNIGFMVADHLANSLGESFRRLRFSSMIAETQHNGQKLVIAKPRTYMNNSGQAVRSIRDYFRLPLVNILIIYDDADLEFETIRLRPNGGSSGQKGMTSIITSLGTEEIPRMRIGVGRPPGQIQTADYVLKPFPGPEKELLPFVLQKATDAALTFISEGILPAMNQFNARQK